jgi:hypothetical protein
MRSSFRPILKYSVRAVPLRKSGQEGSSLFGLGSAGFARSFRKVPWTTFICVGFGFLPAVICFHKPAVFLWAFQTNHDTIAVIRSGNQASP